MTQRRWKLEGRRWDDLHLPPSAIDHRWRDWASLMAVCCMLGAMLTGCESLERKFTRKKRTEQTRLSPVINFEDYSRSMTPVDRYRKHYMIFDYWNAELITALQSAPANPKRVKLASEESLAELHQMQQLLSEEMAGRLGALIDARAKIIRLLQESAPNFGQASLITHDLDRQARQVHRDFFWRDVEEHLKPAPQN